MPTKRRTSPAKAKSKPKAAKAPKVIRRLENDERRAQLLAIGRKAFAAHPYDEVAIDTLAAKAKLSKGLFYYYFPTKRDLYIAVVEATARELNDALMSAVQERTTPRERAQAGVQAYLEHVATHGHAFVALMRGGLGADPEIAKVLDKVRAEILEKFMKGQPISAFLQARPLSLIAIRAWIGMVEAASIEWLASTNLPKEPVRDLLVDMLFDLLTKVLGREVPQKEFLKSD